MDKAIDLPENFTRADIRKLMETCIGFYPTELLGEAYRGARLTSFEVVLSGNKKLKWKNSLGFFKYVTELTGKTENIKRAYEVLAKWEEKAPEKITDLKEAPSKTTPGSEELKSMQKQAENRRLAQEDAERKAKIANEKRIQELQVEAEKKRRLAKETESVTKKAVVEEDLGVPKQVEQVVYLKPKDPIKVNKLTEEEQLAFKNLVESAQKSPRTFSENLAKKIEEIVPKVDPELAKQIGPKLLKVNAQHVAFEVTKRIVAGTSSFINPWVMKPFVDPGSPQIKTLVPQESERIELAGAAQKLATVSEHDYRLMHRFLRPVLGNGITTSVLGTDEKIEYELTDNPNEAHHIINLGELKNFYRVEQRISQPLYRDFESGNSEQSYQESSSAFEYLAKNVDWYKAGDFFSKVASNTLFRTGIATVTAVEGYKAGLVVGGVVGKATPLLLGSSVRLLAAPGASSIIVTPIFEKQIGNFAIKIATATKAGQTFLGIGISTGTKTTATLIGPGVLSKLGAALGSAAPIIGTIIGAVVGWIAGKLLPKILLWLKKHKEDIAILALIPLAIGVGIGSLPLIAIGSFLLLGGLFASAGGIGAVGSGIGGVVATSFYGLLFAGFRSIVVPVLVSVFSVIFLTASILFIINSGAYIVPPAPVVDNPFAPGGGGAPVVCSPTKLPVPFAVNGSSPIAKRAWEITSDLYQGFWCFWNRPPGDFAGDTATYPPAYPNLFDEALFARNSNPSRQEISVCGDCMFWCTYLVVKSYTETGNRSLEITLWSPTMQADFQRRGKLITRTNATPENVVPGSVVFFKILPGPDRTNHVAIVHSVSQDGVVYVQSNASTKSGSLTFNSSGRGIQNMPGIEIVGIGTP